MASIEEVVGRREQEQEPARRSSCRAGNGRSDATASQHWQQSGVYYQRRLAWQNSVEVERRMSGSELEGEGDEAEAEEPKRRADHPEGIEVSRRAWCLGDEAGAGGGAAAESRDDGGIAKKAVAMSSQKKSVGVIAVGGY